MQLPCGREEKYTIYGRKYRSFITTASEDIIVFNKASEYVYIRQGIAIKKLLSFCLFS
jgi:hypothetical protein